MSKNTIKIDGAKLKGLLEYYAKKSLYHISEDEGFSLSSLQIRESVSDRPSSSEKLRNRAGAV